MPPWVRFLFQLLMGERTFFSLILFSLRITHTDTQISYSLNISFLFLSVCACVLVDRIGWSSSVLAKAQL